MAVEGPFFAVIVTVTLDGTAFVITLKVTEVFPGGTVTDVGTSAEVALLVSVITSPGVGAGEVILIVPELEDPPVTEEGLNVSVLNEGGSMVRVPF